MTEERFGNNVVIHETAEIGEGVRIGHNTIVNAKVVIGEGTIIGNNVVLGEKTAGFYSDPDSHEQKPLIIGKKCVIRSGTILYEGSEFGDFFQTGNCAVIREGNKFGKSCIVGSHTQLENDITVGNGTRLLSLVEIGKKAVIGNFVWMFSQSIMADDPHPPCGKCLRAAKIGDYSIIGPQTIIMPKLEIGENVIIGSNSVVTKDVENGKVAMGTPAKVVRETTEITCKEGLVDQPYPWFPNLPEHKLKRYNFDQF